MYEKTLKKTRIFSGNILDFEVLEVELEDGHLSQREIVSHKGAVGVLARKPDGTFVMVRQFRKPVEGYCLEIVAGLMEDDELPAECARREMAEETGYEVRNLVALGKVALSPGYSTERIHLFYAEIGESPSDQKLDDGEHCEVVELERTQFKSKLKRGEIEDGKTLAAWLLFENRIAQLS